MVTRTKRTNVLTATVFLVFFFTSYASLYAGQSQKSTVEKLLDILEQKGIITEEQHRDLKDELGEEEKEQEEQQQVVEEIKTKEEKRPKVGYKNGFYLEKPEKDFKLKIGGRAYGDFRAYNSDHPSNDEFYVSRARIYLSGTIYKYFDFKVQADFGKGSSKLKDGFVKLTYFPAAQIMAGQFKAPFSLEKMTSSKYFTFIERSLPADNLPPDRDVGLMVHGAYKPMGLYYGAGIFNGARANESDADDHKDFVGRLAMTPFTERGPSFLKGLHLGFSTSYGEQDVEYPNDKDSIWNKGELKTAGDSEFFQLNNGVVHDGKRTRLGTELAWVMGPVTLQGEWMRVDLDDMENFRGDSHDLSMKGYYVSLSYFITGEERNYGVSRAAFKRTKIKRIFDPARGQWGAFQLCIRYDRLEVSDGFFDHGYVNERDYTDRASGVTVGINWYFNDMMRFMLNYNHVDFDDYVQDADGDWEDAFLARFQLDF
jgi:phosphate-selective porin OprO/OprP